MTYFNLSLSLSLMLTCPCHIDFLHPTVYLPAFTIYRIFIDWTIVYIYLGGWNNSNSAIRTIKQQLPGVAQVWSEPLDCNVSKPFWISWANGEIQVGSGRIVGSDMFMSYVSNSAAVVNYIAVATGFGSSGIWRFGKLSKT